MAEIPIRVLLRRAGALLLLVPVALAGCGRAGADDGRGAASHTPATTRSATPGPSPTTTDSASPRGAGIPDDFPLGLGLVADGDTSVTPPRRDARGVDLQARCWDHAWPGATVDRLVVEQVGPELGVTRELVLYPDVATARAVVQRVSARAQQCRLLPATSRGPALHVTPYDDVDSGTAQVSAQMPASFSETPADGQPGGALFELTRVGRAVLAVEDSGEWTRDSAVKGIRVLRRADRDVVARLCVFSKGGC
jgi:hypothetical protein